MALGTLGTNGTNTLTSFIRSTNTSAADIAALSNSIKNDQINGRPIYPGAYMTNGLLYVPNRGVLKVFRGDYIGVDATGWPILVAAAAIASLSPATSWTHS